MVPLGVIGAIVLTYLGMIIKGDPNLSNNIYFQVAIIAVIGLSTMNGLAYHLKNVSLVLKRRSYTHFHC
ncbi:hypothetical protein EDM35_15960 [Staphylococcus aureus]|nr:hypothetical protein EDM47_15960 [Staphylococcus aureus]RNB22539.1 hypothetical protein EDM35_15960 [Staphylococcus aureus]